ncbi:hypothetical protein MVEN_01167000 [Mycena venus]|uniref:Uncharacterized protein n=1 Tax=Mycena venus TaxID=2733690 RepID=A0A8H7CVP1_9AGAR|nr:hypothetical protein MVEN_01167000 [Mycena venus]
MMIFLAVATLLWLLTSTDAHNIPLNDIQCPKGSHHGFVQNSYQFYGPLRKFTDITGSFFDISWLAGGEILSTTGTNNIPGATRVGPFDPLSKDPLFNETLTVYDVGPGTLRFTFTGPGAPLTYHSRTGEVITFHYYAETQHYESICGGTATYLHATTHICSDNPALAYDLFCRLHQGTFHGYDALPARVKEKTFTGDCPQRSERNPIGRETVHEEL